MKKILLAVFGGVVLSSSLVSCSSDDDSKNGTRLDGKWNFVHELALDADGNVVSTYTEDNGACPDDVYNFIANGDFEMEDYDEESSLSDCKATIVKGAWGITGDTFRLKSEHTDNEFESFTIKTLSEDTFEFEAPLSREDAGEYELNVVKLRHVFKRVK